MAGFKGTSFVEVIGYVGRDPELRSTASGSHVCNFSIPVEQGYGDNKVTEWYECVAFGKRAETIQSYVKKGSVLRVTGVMSTSKWEKDGVKHQRTSLLVDDFKFLPGNKRNQDADEEPDARPVTDKGKAEPEDEPLPF